MLERGFLIFKIFLLFFLEFSCPGRVRTEFQTKIFCIFFGLSHPVLAKNIAGKSFFNFFAIFFSEFSSLGRVITEFVAKFFFFLFFGLSHPVLAKNNAGMSF